MNLIATALWSVAQPFLAWLGGFYGRKILMVTTSITSFIFITAAFIVCIKYFIVTLLAMAVMPTWFYAAFSSFVPGNFVSILSSIMSARTCRWAYDKALDKIRLINNAS